MAQDNMQMLNETSGFEEVVFQIKRVSKKTKGGNKARFSALVVMGDKQGLVGVGLSKGLDVRTAIEKARRYAQRRMIKVPQKGDTIPYQIEKKFGAARILLKPAPPGTGIIAGGAIRVVLELAGIRDGVGKIMGTNNKATNVYATIEALKDLDIIYQRRSK